MTAGPGRYVPREDQVLDAWEVTDDNIGDVAAWCGGTIREKPVRFLLVPAIGGQSLANIGSWVLRGVTGRFFTRSAKDFAAQYKPAPQTSITAVITQQGPPFDNGQDWMNDARRRFDGGAAGMAMRV